ncbi:unnamed protein product [Blepharisma stoltei]|uniref:Uncharacterized protein n=1 Tax=Blepharisma stoltei TaxID=1481888 RepID=A0AAU9K3I7_9CILI|nr:unnamed protein product [Blepharisma stoltei]
MEYWKKPNYLDFLKPRGKLWNTPFFRDLSNERKQENKAESNSYRNKHKPSHRQAESEVLDELKNLIEKSFIEKSSQKKDLKKPINKRCNSETKFSSRFPEIYQENEVRSYIYKKRPKRKSPKLIISNRNPTPRTFLSNPVEFPKSRPFMRMISNTKMPHSSRNEGSMSVKRLDLTKPKNRVISILPQKKRNQSVAKIEINLFPKKIEAQNELQSFDDSFSSSSESSYMETHLSPKINI